MDNSDCSTDVLRRQRWSSPVAHIEQEVFTFVYALPTWLPVMLPNLSNRSSHLETPIGASKRIVDQRVQNPMWSLLLEGFRLDHQRGRKHLCQHKQCVSILWRCATNDRRHARVSRSTSTFPLYGPSSLPVRGGDRVQVRALHCDRVAQPCLQRSGDIPHNILVRSVAHNVDQYEAHRHVFA